MNRNNGKKVNIYLILMIVFIVAAVICLGFWIKDLIDRKNYEDKFQGMVKSIETEPSSSESQQDSKEPSESSADPTGDETGEPTDEPTESSEEEILDPYEKSVKQIEEAGVTIPNIEVNLEELQQTVNPDIYAWIYIPGTKVNYPILQHPTDDSYYLNYNLDGKKGYPGCIYTEKTYNNKDFRDVNTVLYGHNMKNGTMFGSLHRYEDEEFFYENRYIYVYTQERVLAYKIFAAYEYSNEHILANNKFDVADGFYRFFMLAKNRKSMHSIFDEEVELLGDGQHVITLSTCINGKPENRFLVQGVLINEE